MAFGQEVYHIHMIRVQISLPESLYTRIKLQARAQSRPASQLIREELERGFLSSVVKQKKEQRPRGGY